MSLIKRLLIIILFVALIPAGMQAQEHRKFEINVGISSPGLHCRADRDIINFKIPYEYEENGEIITHNHYSDKYLHDIYLESYRSRLYPGLSVEFSYKLSDSGFTKRMSLIGMLGFNMVDFENEDLATRNVTKEKSYKIDYLIGFRVYMIKSLYFDVYSQLLAGGEIRDKSLYWDITEKRLDEYNVELNGMSFQITYVGFRAKIGKRNSRLGVYVEFGHGTEYSTSKFALIPGIRTGASYLF
ncbi:MAG: hypothetical protein J6P66_08250 [Bacteroidaceae bacterium]|nr:hypothetical protein [Bacteroidaceae bacterium]